MRWSCIFCFFVAGLPFVQADTNSFASAMLRLNELADRGAFDEGLEWVEISGQNFTTADERAILSRWAASLKEQRKLAIELDAATKGLVLDRSGKLEDARTWLLASSKNGRLYLRSLMNGSDERAAEFAANALVKMNDRHAADLMIKRLASYFDWSVFLVPLLGEVSEQFTPAHISSLIGYAQYNNTLQPTIIDVLFDGLTHYARPPVPSVASRKKELPEKLDWTALQTHLPGNVQDALGRLLVRIVEQGDEKPLSAEGIARARAILVGSEFPTAHHSVLKKLSEELPEAEMVRWSEIFSEMGNAVDVRSVQALANYASRNSPQQIESGKLLLESLSRIARSSESPERALSRTPPEVETLPMRLKPPQQEAVIRAGLSILENHGSNEDSKAKAVCIRFQELFLQARFDMFPELLVSEIRRDAKRPSTGLYIKLASQMPGRMKNLDNNQQRSLHEAILLFAETRADQQNEASELKLARTLLVESELPDTPNYLTGKLLSVGDGAFADWLSKTMEAMILRCEPGVVRSLANHVISSGQQRDAAAELLVLHLEQLAWHPEKAPPRLQAGQTRLDRLPQRLNPGLCREVTRALVTQRVAMDLQQALPSSEQQFRSRIDQILVDARFPDSAGYLVDAVNSNPQQVQVSSYLDLLAKMEGLLGAIDENRQANFVHSVVRFVEHYAKDPADSASRSASGKASKVLKVAAFPRTGEWVCSRMGDLKKKSAIAWGVNAVVGAPDLTGRSVITALSDRTREQGEYQLLAGRGLLVALDRLSSGNNFRNLSTVLEPDTQERVVHAMMAFHISISDRIAKEPKSPEFGAWRRDQQKIHTILTQSHLSVIPKFMVSELGRSPDKTRSEYLVKLLPGMEGQFVTLDTNSEEAFLNALIQISKSRVSSDESKSIVGQTCRALSHSGLPGMPNRIAGKLRGYQADALSEWLARALDQVPQALDHDAISSICGAIESGAKTDTLLANVLIRDLRARAGENTLENLAFVLPPATQTSVANAMRNYLQRTLSRDAKPEGLTASTVHGARQILSDGGAPGAIGLVMNEFNRDPVGKLADTWIDLMERHPQKLKVVNTSYRNSFGASLLKYVAARDGAYAEKARKLMFMRLVPNLMPAIAAELSKKPESDFSYALIGVVQQNQDELAALAPQHRMQLAEGMLAVLEARPGDNSLQGKCDRLLGEAMPSSIARKLVEKVSANPGEAEFMLYTRLLRAVATQVEQSQFTQLSKLVEASEDPRQGELKRTVSWIKPRMVNP